VMEPQGNHDNSNMGGGAAVRRRVSSSRRSDDHHASFLHVLKATAWTCPPELLTILSCPGSSYCSTLSDWAAAVLRDVEISDEERSSSSLDSAILQFLCWVDRNKRAIVDSYIQDRQTLREKLDRYNDRVVSAIEAIREIVPRDPDDPEMGRSERDDSIV